MMTELENKFTVSLDTIYKELTRDKITITKHLKKNYKLDIHYIIVDTIKNDKQHGGHNKITYMLTQESADILKNSFNLRNKYITDISTSVKYVNLGMCIENQTIGFIQNCFKDCYESKRQYSIGKYRVDLYFPKNKLVIECDENNHNDRNPIKEKERYNYIISKEYQIIRFNPNLRDFDISNVIRVILQALIKG